MEEAGVAKYRIEYKTSTGNWTLGKEEESTATSKQITFGVPTYNTTYTLRAKVTDKAGNEGTSTGSYSVTTQVANTKPYNLTTTAPSNNRTTYSLTITASATDDEQSTLYYDLYWNGSGAIKETKSATKDNPVTFTQITGLNMATYYSWKIVVRDNNGGSAEKAGYAYTNCSGQTLSCSRAELRLIAQLATTGQNVVIINNSFLTMMTGQTHGSSSYASCDNCRHPGL